MRVLATLAVALLQGALYAPSSRLPPNGTLTVAYREREAGRLSEAVHVASLYCFDGDCSLTMLALNDCVLALAASRTGGGEREGHLAAGWSPLKITELRTRGGDFTVKPFGESSLIIETPNPSKRLFMKIDYTATQMTALSRAGGLQQDRWFEHNARSLSGTMTEIRGTAMNRMARELVPVRHDDQLVTMTCPILVPGVLE